MRVAAVIDVLNIMHTVSKHFDGQKVDYRKIFSRIQNYGEVMVAYAYTAYRQNEPTKFIDILKEIGFIVKIKKTDIFENNMVDFNEKADWDVEMAFDAFFTFNHIDVLFLGTADGDQERTCLEAKRAGIKVVVFGCKISRKLRQLADETIEIDRTFLL